MFSLQPLSSLSNADVRFSNLSNTASATRSASVAETFETVIYSITAILISSLVLLLPLVDSFLAFVCFPIVVVGLRAFRF